MALLDARGFGEEDFAGTHPGGSLGRRLLVHVEDVMRTGEAIPVVKSGALLGEALLEMSRKGLGMTAVVDGDNRLLGVFTDGDLRRALEKPANLREARIDELMTRHPLTISPRRLAAEAAQVMQDHRILAMVVIDGERRLIGAFNMHELLRAGVI